MLFKRGLVNKKTHHECLHLKNTIIQYLIILKLFESCLAMNKTYDYDIFSFKYVAASFFATYFAGIVHPLDLIKTRFQSKPYIIQAMMVRLQVRILYLNIMELRMHLIRSTKMKDLKVFIRDFIFPYYAKLHPCPSFSGSKIVLIQI